MKRIMIVDDDPINLAIAKKDLKKEYEVITANSGYEALEILSKIRPDLILLDVLMSGMDGIETLKKIRKSDRSEEIPVIFLTSVDDKEIEQRCFKVGAIEFITKPFSAPIMRLRIKRILELYELKRNLEMQVIAKSGQLEKVTLQAITAIANTIDAKDAYTKGHSLRVAAYSEEIARRLGWPEKEVMNLHYIALLHDIGKIGVPDAVLNKPAPLSSEEFEIIKKHTVIGAEILKDMTLIKNVSEGAKYHHERYDGAGYNEGLKGEEIPIVARIICLADAYDAMTSNRAYRSKLGEENVRNELLSGRGAQFDPALTDILLDIMDEKFSISEDFLSEAQGEDLAVKSSFLLQKVLTDYALEIKDVSQRDALTGLWNRRYTEGQVNGYLWNELHNGVLYLIDLDNFKLVNDTYGHISGDDLLRKFSQAMLSLVDKNDLVCRVGGDEFIIFVRDINSRFLAEEIAKQIIAVFSQISTKYADANASVSIGIAIACEDGADFHTLYGNADKSLYFVKQNGKNSYHFFREENEETRNQPINTVGDLATLKNMITERSNKHGAYKVEYDSFKRIFQFIERYMSRTKQPVQLLLLSLSDNEGKIPGGDVLPAAVEVLIRAINFSLRRGDVATEYSSSQYLVLLIDSSENDGNVIADRIRNSFTRLNTNLEISLHYDIQSLGDNPTKISEE